MGKKKKPQVSVSVYGQINKAETSVIIDSDDSSNEWLEPELDHRGLAQIVDNSNILPQCIRAYKQNIAGFGFKIEYNEDIPETKEMAAEFDKLQSILDSLSSEKATKELFEDIIEARETYGVAYVEVIRNRINEVCSLSFLNNTPSVRKTKLQKNYVKYTRYNRGVAIPAKKRFRRYKQEIGGQTVFFKEFGDPRIMDWRDG